VRGCPILRKPGASCSAAFLEVKRLSSKRVLIVSGDILPLPGFPTTGAGLRAWGLGKGLETYGQEVIFSMPALYLDKVQQAPKEITDYAWRVGKVKQVIQKARPDMVVFCHWPAVQIEKKLDIPTVLDFHGPHLLEREIQGYNNRAANVQAKIDAIRKADFFTCAGEKQRLYFLSWLIAAGISVSEQSIASIPISLSPDLPVHAPSNGQPVFVYGGVFLPWQNPAAGLRTLVRSMEAREYGQLKFFGGRHPVYAEQIGNLELFEALEQELMRSPRVQCMGFVPHDELVGEYLRAHVALDVMARNPERELAFTTRTVEYLWCGLPVIYHDYAELSDLIREYQAGWVVDPADVAQIQAAIDQALTCPDEVHRRSENAQRLVRERLTWDKAIAPLDTFCHDPWRQEPLSLPGEDDSPKNLPTLAREVLYHLRHGGVRAMAYYALGFLQKRFEINGR
jgi:glycosyltransferase involved in cell wall biosynthesis